MENLKKKHRNVERRLQMQINNGTKKITDLGEQISFLERERVEIWSKTEEDRINQNKKNHNNNATTNNYVETNHNKPAEKEIFHEEKEIIEQREVKVRQNITTADEK